MTTSLMTVLLFYFVYAYKLRCQLLSNEQYDDGLTVTY